MFYHILLILITCNSHCQLDCLKLFHFLARGRKSVFSRKFPSIDYSGTGKVRSTVHDVDMRKVAPSVLATRQDVRQGHLTGVRWTVIVGRKKTGSLKKEHKKSLGIYFSRGSFLKAKRLLKSPRLNVSLSNISSQIFITLSHKMVNFSFVSTKHYSLILQRKCIAFS